MRDGTILRADVFLPADRPGPFPALLPWSPFGKTGTGILKIPDFTFIGVTQEKMSGYEKWEAPDPAEWCSRGYAIVNVDTRGIFDSKGDIFVYGTQEGRDGHDTIEWIGTQEWCTGKVALVGNSWLATTQWLIAAEQPPHLTAIAPWEGMGDYYRESICRGGIPNHAFWDFLIGTFNGRNQREDPGAMVEKYPMFNAYWADKKPKLQNIKIPMYVLASYSTGLHTVGSIRGWQYSSTPAKDKWLRIHPTQEWHDIYQTDGNDDLQRFMDHYLKGSDNGWQYTPKVRLSLLRYNAPPISFRAEDTYPPSRVRYDTLYLDAQNQTMSKEQSSTEMSVDYQSDSWDDDGVRFKFTFDHATELIGYSKVKLFMSCKDLDDMDVYVILRKLDKNGKALLNYNIPPQDWPHGTKQSDMPWQNIYIHLGQNGRLRASKRATAEEPGLTAEMRKTRSPAEIYHPHDKEEKVPPGEVVELDIGIWPAGVVFEAGESLALEVKGHDPMAPEFPQLERAMPNLNKGRHVVHTGGRYASSLLLPLTSK